MISGSTYFLFICAKYFYNHVLKRHNPYSNHNVINITQYLNV